MLQINCRIQDILIVFLMFLKFLFKFFSNMPCWLGLSNTPITFLQRYNPPPILTRPFVSRGWQPIILEDRISGGWAIWLTQQLKLPHDLQHSSLALTGQDRWSVKPNLINQLVMSSSRTYMLVSTGFFKFALVENKYPTLFHLKDAGRWWLSAKLHWNNNTWNHLNCVQINN